MKLTRLVLSLALAFGLAEAKADRLVIKGSDTLGAKLVPQLAEHFKAAHPGTTFDIAAEGSTTGIAAIIDGTAEIGMSSRRAKSSEVGAATAKGRNMKPVIVAYDGIAVIVNSANPVKSLTKKQVEQIFTGDVSDWSAVGGSGGKISIYTRNTSSGTYSEFKELAMKKRDYAGNGDTFNIHYQGGSPFVTNSVSLAQNQTGINSLLVFDMPWEVGWKLGELPMHIFGDFSVNLEGDDRPTAADWPNSLLISQSAQPAKRSSLRSDSYPLSDRVITSRHPNVTI